MQLLGDLLYKISGLSGKMSTESAEDDNFGTEEARQAILRNLGMERRNRVLSGLYMGRWVEKWALERTSIRCCFSKGLGMCSKIMWVQLLFLAYLNAYKYMLN